MSEIELAEGKSSAPGAADAALLEGLRARSPEACAALYDRYATGIHRFAVTRLGDIGAAEDVVVETMAWVVRDIARFAPQQIHLGGLGVWDREAAGAAGASPQEAPQVGAG